MYAIDSSLNVPTLSIFTFLEYHVPYSESSVTTIETFIYKKIEMKD